MIKMMPHSVRRYLPVLLALLCLVTLLPGLFLSFEDSEIWGITSSRRIIDQPLVITSAHYKPLFSLIFGSVTALSSSDWGALVAARLVTMIFGAFGLFAFYTFGVSMLNRDRPISISLIFYALLATMPMMVLHFTKARSDTLAASIVFIGVFAIAALESRRFYLRGLTYFVAGLAALLVTPKSIDLLLILMIVFWFSSEETDRKSRWLWMSGPIVAPLLFGLLFTRELFVHSIVYWFDSYEGVQFFSRLPWVSFLRAAEAAPITSLAIIAGLTMGALQLKKLSRNERTMVLIGLVTAGFIILHSQKFFFFLASRAPFLALGALPGFHALVAIAERKLDSKTTLRGLLAVSSISLAISVLRFQQSSSFQQPYQHAVHDSLRAYLDRANPNSYWDAIGLFPKRNTVFHYPSPNDRGNADLLQYVDMSRPTMILRTSKMELLEPQFMLWLRNQYIQLNEQIYVRFRTIPRTKTCRVSPGELIALTEQEKFNFPLALFVRTPSVQTWVRTSFYSQHGIEHRVLDKKTLLRGKIELRDCLRWGVEYVFTEAGPWDSPAAPSFTPFFGYDGTL